MGSTTEAPFRTEQPDTQDMPKIERDLPASNSMRWTHQSSSIIGTKLGRTLQTTGQSQFNSSNIPSIRHNQTARGFQKQEEFRIQKENIRLAKKISETKSDLNKQVIHRQISKATTFKALQSQLERQGKPSVNTKLEGILEKFDYPDRFKKRFEQGLSFRKVD